MPVDRWFITSITQTHMLGGFKIVVNTDAPCHLHLYWTSHQPWTHRTSTITRGLNVPWDSYWCFVAWQTIDQEEAGDTTDHTFFWLDWAHCNTRYFRFHGTIGGVNSPSDSAIYHKHYQSPWYTEYLNYPPVDPKTHIGNYRWWASPFECGKTGTPTTIKIWHFRSLVLLYDLGFYIEDAYLHPDYGWRPYVDQTGHIKCQELITQADANLITGSWRYFQRVFDTSSLLVKNQHYCLVTRGTSFDYKCRDGLVIPDSYQTWYSNDDDPTVRNFSTFDYDRLTAAEVI